MSRQSRRAIDQMPVDRGYRLQGEMDVVPVDAAGQHQPTGRVDNVFRGAEIMA